MEIKLKCECGQVLKVGTEAAGKMGKCPACNNRIRIPTIEEIEQAREQQSGEVAAAEPAQEKQAAKKTSTRKFKAPGRPKTRSKSRALVKEEREERKKGKSKTRGKTRTKGRRTTTVMDKYRRKGAGDEEEEESRYAAKKKSPLKILIVIGIIVIGGLIAAYALHWGPIGKAKQRTRDYVMAMQQFVIDVRDNMVEKYEKQMPASTSDYDRRLEEIEEDAKLVLETMTPKMRNAYRADDLMRETMRAFKNARKLINDRVEAERELKLTEANLAELKQQFTLLIAQANAKVADIEKYLNNLKPQVGMSVYLE